MQEAINRLNAALTRAGCSPLNAEQLACLVDPAARDDALGMLDDIAERCLNEPCPAIDDIKGQLLAPRSVYFASMTPEQFHAAAVQVTQEEILERVSMGQIPATVGSFSELHNYMDANCLGGLCDEELQPVFDSVFPYAPSDDPEVIGSEKFTDAANALQNAIDAWIKAGGITAAVEMWREA